MRIEHLHLKNIGPFIEGEIDFSPLDANSSLPPVTIITGENGTGKTVILDAIRAMFYGSINKIERNIVRDSNDFACTMRYSCNKYVVEFTASQIDNHGRFATNNVGLGERFHGLTPDSTWNWVANYWTSKLSTDSFEVKGLTSPVINHLYFNSLSGIHPNVEVAQLICFFDYLRSSENPQEQLAGEKLYSTLKKIVKLSLLDGEFRYVSRTRLEPIVVQNGQEITLDKISSGSLYLIQRMVSLLGKMYICHVINNTPIEQLCHAPGFLLIDEAENHLHPKWQKIFISSIQEIFPRLQIIATTHSPFIVASAENARIYVCQSMGGHAIITDETASYSNKSIEEILISPLFGSTYPFNKDITELMQRRKAAIQLKDHALRAEIEQKLQELNPQYFSFFGIDKLLNELTQK